MSVVPPFFERKKVFFVSQIKKIFSLFFYEKTKLNLKKNGFFVSHFLRKILILYFITIIILNKKKFKI